jgi:serine phosphatase RsbU (regulator of sigma subunit)/CheY-like chemotaxis protein
MTASKILVVEDEGLVGLELTESLARMGYDVLPAVPTGREALERAAREKPDLVLMDIRLSGALDGIDTARALRDRHNIPVVYLTAHSDETTLQRAKQSEAFGYLLKPFEHRTLRAAVETALYKAQRERERENGFDWDESIGEHLADGLVIADARGIVRFVNRSAARLAGRESAACRGVPFADLYPAADPLTGEEVSLPLAAVMVEDRTIVSDRLLRIGPAGQGAPAEYVMQPAKNRRGEAVGVICLFKAVGENEARDRNVRFELEQSRHYQLGLLPEKGRSVSGVASNWLFRPSAYGSGDMFNVFPLNGRRVGFFLLDVMGHGFRSAVLAVSVYSFLLSEIASPGRAGDDPALLTGEGEVPIPAPVLPPRAVIAELNRRFYLRKDDHPFFTIVYGVIDTGTNRGVLARAGHHFPLLADAAGRLERIGGRGQAIGAFPEADVEEVEFDFSPGRRLYLYSDGLLEALAGAAGRSDASDDTLVAILAGRPRDGLAETCLELERRLGEIGPRSQEEDDIAFFALERE